MARKSLRSGLLPRALATGRIAGALGRSAAGRLIGSAREVELGETLFNELDHLKGMAMKVGQILSYMEVGLPEATAQRLAKLQHGAEPLDFEAIRPIVEAELKGELGSLFEDFDPVAVAAASIGQVHRATYDGHPVAVKVRYPGVIESLSSDFRQLGALGRLASLGAAVDGPALVKELRERVIEECDYAREARQQRLFHDILSPVEGLCCPDIVPERCSGSVLTSSWMEGKRFAELASGTEQERRMAGMALARLPWVTFFGHGLLHADPHPGNFLFSDEVVVLDFGCTKRFHLDEVETFRALLRAMLVQDRSSTRALAIEVGLVPRPEKIDWESLFALFDLMVEPYRVPSFRFSKAWWAKAMVFSRPTNRNNRHLAFPPSWVWIQRTIWGLHGVLTRLDVALPLRDLTPLLEVPCHEPSIPTSDESSSSG